MSQANPMTGTNANRPRAVACTIDAQTVHLNDLISECVKAVFIKPCRVLSDLFKINERGAKYKLGGGRNYSALELSKLIQTEEGFKFVSALMAEANPVPEWWRICKPVMEAAEIRKMQIAAQRRVAKALGDAIDANRVLSASIERAEAISVQHEEQAGNEGHALGALVRSFHRPVARKRRG